MTTLPPLEQATLAGGCFWCLEAVYREVAGVRTVESGYAGGHVPNPSYEEVCSGATGHAEAVQITFDPAIIRYDELLEIFFAIHDPTTLNRQGADVGTQYRSAIYYHSAGQKAAAGQAIAQAAAHWQQPIVTELAALDQFYRAEDYHQDYFAKHPYQGYCRAVIHPKLAKFRQVFQEKRKTNS